MKRKTSFGDIWRVMAPLLTYYGVYYLIFILAGILGVTFSMVSLEQSSRTIDYYVLLEETALWVQRYSLEIGLVTTVLALIPLVTYRILDNRRSAEKTFRYESPHPLFYAVAMLLGAAACLAVNGLMNMSGLMQAYSANAEEVGEALYQGKLFLEILGIGILSPLAEEILFRGLVMDRMKEWMPANAAIIASAVMFALYHGNTLQGIYGLVMGLLFGYVYDKFHRLAAPVLVHMGANLVSVAASETGLLNEILTGEMSLILFSGISCAAMAALLYVVHTWVNPSLVQREE